MSSTPHGNAPQPTVDAQSTGDDKKGARRGAIFIGCVLVVYVVYLVMSGQVAQFVDAMANIKVSWLLVACFFMLLYLVFGIIAYAIAVWLDPDSPVGIRDLISVEASGIFFGNLTPMMMGSTPAQIYRLTKAGQNVGEAGATQFTRFIVYQFGLCAWGAILLAARLGFFTGLYGNMVLLCAFSFGGHVCILIGIFAVALCPRGVTRLAHWLISILARLGVEEDKIENWREFVDEEIYSFSQKFKHSAGHFSSMALTVVITMLQLLFFYMVPFFLLYAFGCGEASDFVTVIAAAAFVQLLSSAVPLPGGTGGAEGGFALFLGHMFGPSATAAFLVWRLVTFFAPTLLSAPLLGLKSARHASIHARWDRLMRRFGLSSKKPAAPAPDPVAEFNRAKRQEEETRRVRRAGTVVTRAPGGVTVSPHSLKRKGENSPSDE